MKAFNVSKKSVLTENILIVSSLSAKAKGLIGKSSPVALFFKTRWGIHTFGLKFPIDCLVCDADWKIKAMRQNIRPNRFFFWWPGYMNILELPTGTIHKTNTKTGDELKLLL